MKAKPGDSWDEALRLRGIARGGRTDNEILKHGLADPAASRRATAMMNRLFAAEPARHDLGPQRRMTRAEQKGTPNDPAWHRDDARKPKIIANSFERYRATALERRMYGGATVTKFYVYRAEDKDNPSKWLVIVGYGPTPGERKTDAIRRSGLA